MGFRQLSIGIIESRKKIKYILQKYAPLIKQASVDEFYMNFIGTKYLYGSINFRTKDEEKGSIQQGKPQIYRDEFKWKVVIEQRNYSSRYKT